MDDLAPVIPEFNADEAIGYLLFLLWFLFCVFVTAKVMIYLERRGQKKS